MRPNSVAPPFALFEGWVPRQLAPKGFSKSQELKAKSQLLEFHETPPISFFVGFTRIANSTVAAIATVAPIPNSVGSGTIS